MSCGLETKRPLTFHMYISLVSHSLSSSAAPQLKVGTKSGKMSRTIIFCTFVCIFASISLGRSEDDDLKTQFEDFRNHVSNELSAQRRYLGVVQDSLKALGRGNQNGTSSATNAQRLDNAIIKNMSNLSAEVQVIGAEVTNLKNNYNKLEALNSSVQMIKSEVRAAGRALASLEEATNSSLQMMAMKLEGLSSAVSSSSTISARGIIVAQGDGVVSIALPSLQQSRVSNDPSFQVAFEPWSRKVYWLNGDYDIKRANLDGTHVELVAEGKIGSFALDTITGNLDYQNYSSNEVRVCGRSGVEMVQNCSTVASNQNAYGLALYPSKRLLFWTANRTSVLRANMDGSDATVILSERIRRLDVDEDSDRAYWTPDRKRGEGGLLASCDLNGQDVRVLVNATTLLSGVAVDTDRVYFGELNDKRVRSVDKEGGSSTVVAKTTGRVYGIALYGSRELSLEHPCRRGRHTCSHLCVLKLDSFACLCAEGEQLAEDGATCV